MALSHFLQKLEELDSTATCTEVTDLLSSFTPSRHLTIVEVEGIKALLDDSNEMRILAALCILERFDEILNKIFHVPSVKNVSLICFS